MKSNKVGRSNDALENLEYTDFDSDKAYRKFFGRGVNRYAVYPSYWADTWGKPPLLGIVSADNEFLAERVCYDRGILSPNNCTFKPKFKVLPPMRTVNTPI